MLNKIQDMNKKRFKVTGILSFLIRFFEFPEGHWYRSTSYQTACSYRKLCGHYRTYVEAGTMTCRKSFFFYLPRP